MTSTTTSPKGPTMNSTRIPLNYLTLCDLAFPDTCRLDTQGGAILEPSSILEPDACGAIIPTYFQSFTANEFRHYALLLAFVPFESLSGDDRGDRELIPTFALYEILEANGHCRRVQAIRPFEATTPDAWAKIHNLT